MNTKEVTYIDVTPRDLWRLGKEASSRLDHVRVPPRPAGSSIDIQTYTSGGEVWVKAGLGGISTFDKINLRLNGQHWWKIPANTPIPFGLKVTKNHTDCALAITHYRIEPTHDMPLSKFVSLLKKMSQYAQVAFTGNAFNKKVTQ